MLSTGLSMFSVLAASLSQISFLITLLQTVRGQRGIPMKLPDTETTSRLDDFSLKEAS